MKISRLRLTLFGVGFIVIVYFMASDFIMTSASGFNFKHLCDAWLETKGSYSESHVSVDAFPNLKGYILVLDTIQQAQSSLIELSVLMGIAASLSLQIVEPTVHYNRFMMTPNHKVGRDVDLLRFSDLYDLNAANDQLRECLGMDYPIIAPLEQFASATSSSAELIYLNLMKEQIDKWCYNEQQKQSHIRSVKQWIDLSLTQIQVPITASESHILLNALPFNNLHFSKIVCVNAMGKINVTKVFSDAIRVGSGYGSQPTNKSNKVILVLHQWIGIKSEPHSFFYYDPGNVHRSCRTTPTLPHSKAIKAAAQQLINSMNLSRPIVGIHIRLEKLLVHSFHIEECIDKAITALEILRDDYGLDLHNAVLIRDYGAFGSTTCTSRCKNIARKMALDERVKRLEVQIIEYKNTFPCTTGDRVLISLVENELITHFDYLLTVGYGSFTHSLIETFELNSPKQRSFQVCHGRSPHLSTDHMP